jgi:A/G-specific adenine glycosylase
VLLSNDQISSFQQLIYAFYKEHGRSFAWRVHHDPYRVLVSEIMLQQTQTYRVEPKFEHFITTFNSFAELANADMRDLFCVWQGLGYNRRAKALHAIAQQVMQNYDGILPASVELLQALPGIGHATASSICAFAFDMPTIFIETNIRAVFIHTFFSDTPEAISDKALLPLIQQTLDCTQPRQWYYALMDYGVHLKKEHKNPARRSAHYTKQSRFEGSDRQIRGAIIRQLANNGAVSRHALVVVINDDAPRVERIIDQLIAEGMIQQTCDQYVMIVG